jgi:CheY-like chemotaxis protein
MMSLTRYLLPKQPWRILMNNIEVIGAGSAEQCLEMLNNGEIPDVILSETMMQGMTGRELSDKLKESPAWQHIPMLFLTVWKDKFEVDSDFSGDSHIEKPFDMVDLKTRIDTVLKKD